MLKSELRKNREKMVKLDEDLARTEDAIIIAYTRLRINNQN